MDGRYEQEDFHSRDEQLAHYGFKPADSQLSPDSSGRHILPLRRRPAFRHSQLSSLSSVSSGEWLTPLHTLDSGSASSTSFEPGNDTELDIQCRNTKTSLLDRVFKRRSTESDDTQAAKRRCVRPALSKHDPGFKRAIKKRARVLADIMCANAEQRIQIEYGQQLVHEQLEEEYHREHPDERPEYQKTYLVEKQKMLYPGTAYEFLQGPRDYEVLVQEYKAKYQNLHASYADTQGPCLELDTQERYQARSDAFERGEILDGIGHKGVGASQKVAVQISKLLDPFKKSDNADMDLGMFDTAPSDMMECCSVCGEPTQSYLVNGVCRFCRYKHGYTCG